MVRWYLRHWYGIGIGVALGALACGVLIQLSTLQQIWLGLAPILFNFVELVLYGVGGPPATRSPYNPGLATFLLWLILSVWYIAKVTHDGLAS